MCPDRRHAVERSGSCAPDSSESRPAKLRVGFTLVELIVSMLVISIALSGTLMVLNTVTVHSADPMIMQQAAAIAEAYLDEITLKSYLDPGPDPDTGQLCPAAEASRNLYDNICDYDGLSDSGARDHNGNAITGLEDYQVDVSVDTTADLNGLSGSSDVLRIDVQVVHSAGVDITLSSYRTDR